MHRLNNMWFLRARDRRVFITTVTIGHHMSKIGHVGQQRVPLRLRLLKHSTRVKTTVRGTGTVLTQCRHVWCRLLRRSVRDESLVVCVSSYQTKLALRHPRRSLAFYWSTFRSSKLLVSPWLQAGTVITSQKKDKRHCCKICRNH